MNSKQRMYDNVAIVTGAARGMGEATARLFAERGAKVVVADINDDAGRRVARDICAAGAEAIYVHCDVSRESDVAALVAPCVDRFGLQ